jgi:hypothetical protein
VVYFKTNKRFIHEYPNLRDYVRDVYQVRWTTRCAPGVGGWLLTSMSSGCSPHLSGRWVGVEGGVAWQKLGIWTSLGCEWRS